MKDNQKPKTGAQELIEILVVEDKNAASGPNSISQLVKKNSIVNKVVQFKSIEEVETYLSGKERMKTCACAGSRLIVLNADGSGDTDNNYVRRRKDADASCAPVLLINSPGEAEQTECMTGRQGGMDTISVPDFSKFSKAVSKLGFYWLLLAPPSR